MSQFEYIGYIAADAEEEEPLRHIFALALDEAVSSGKVKRGQLLLLEAFGGGFTWGSVLLRY